MSNISWQFKPLYYTHTHTHIGNERASTLISVTICKLQPELWLPPITACTCHQPPIAGLHGCCHHAGRSTQSSNDLVNLMLRVCTYSEQEVGALQILTNRSQSWKCGILDAKSMSHLLPKPMEKRTLLGRWRQISSYIMGWIKKYLLNVVFI